jgi:hypothetical protein
VPTSEGLRKGDQGDVLGFTMFKVKHTSNKHWTNYSSRGIVESMNDLLLQSTCNIVNVVNFLFVSADKVTTIDNAPWIFLHIYMLFKLGNESFLWFVWKRLKCNEHVIMCFNSRLKLWRLLLV